MDLQEEGLTTMQDKLNIRLIKSLQPQNKPYEVVDTELKGFLLRIQPSGVMSYYFSYRNAQGKRKRYRIGNQAHMTPAQARDTAETIALKIANGEDAQEKKKQHKIDEAKAKLKTVVGFLENKYAPWVLAERKTGQDTIKRIQRNFQELLPRPMSEINSWIIEKWRSQELKKNKKPISINRDIVALRAMLSKAVEWDFLDFHPLAKLKPMKTDGQGKIRYLSTEEENRLRNALDQREAQIRTERANANKWRQERGYPLFPDLHPEGYVDHLKPIALLAINTGMRRGEIFTLTWENVDFNNRTVTIEGALAKSGKTRHIPLNDQAIKVLRIWKNQSVGSKLVFPSKDGTKLEGIKKSWNNLLLKTGINNFRFHDLRHHFASRLVMAGVDLNTIRELLGHSDIKMTLRYAHLAPEHKAEAVAKLMPRPALKNATEILVLRG